LLRSSLKNAKNILRRIMVDETINKTIWMLWFQGWESAPWLIQNARKSWEIHNTNWNIIFLDEKKSTIIWTI